MIQLDQFQGYLDYLKVVPEGLFETHPIAPVLFNIHIFNTLHISQNAH